MVLTQEEIEDIKAECFANDVSYDYERLKDWDEDTVREWFEAGGDAGSSADAPAFMIAMRAMNADLVARLQEMQPEETMWSPTPCSLRKSRCELSSWMAWCMSGSTSPRT